MKKKVLDVIGMIIITIVIATFSLIVWANEKGLRILPMCVLMFIAVLYLIVRKIMLKQKIVIKNKVDIFVLLFMCSTILPLIFKTYCTLQGAVEFILKYFFVYTIYLVIRNTINSNKKIETLISATIISSLFVIILGIDLQHGQFFKPIINILNLIYTKDTRFSSTFGYANSVAIYIAFCIFLAIHKVQNAKSKIVKAVNIVYVLLGFYIVYITVSRAVLLLLVISLSVYFIMYYYKDIVKNRKKIIIFISIIAIVVAILVAMIKVGLKYSKPLELSDSYEDVVRYPFEKNKEYEIKLEIDIPNNEVEQKNLKIDILEENIYRHENLLASKKIENYEDTISIKFTPDNSLLRIKIKVTNRDQEKIIINKCYINDEEYNFAYKYIPNKIGGLLKTFSLKEASIGQRIDFYKDCLKIAKNNWIIGQGGNTWKNLSQVVQEYQYNMKECHSYFFELLISYGIVGIILFLAVFIGLNINVLQEYKNDKEKNKYKIPILFGLNILILHSLCFDFNMSFLIINLIVFIYIAALMYNSKHDNLTEKKVILNILDYIVLTFLTLILLVFIFANIAGYCVKDNETRKKMCPYNKTYKYICIEENIEKDKDYKYTLQELQELMEKEPYYEQEKVYSIYWNLLFKNINSLNDDEIIYYLKFINNQYKTIKPATPMYIDTIMIRVDRMENCYLRLKNMNYDKEEILDQIEELKQIIKNEYKINIENINDKERNGLPEHQILMIVEKYNKILEIIE